MPWGALRVGADASCFYSDTEGTKLNEAMQLPSGDPEDDQPETAEEWRLLGKLWRAFLMDILEQKNWLDARRKLLRQRAGLSDRDTRKAALKAMEHIDTVDTLPYDPMSPISKMPDLTSGCAETECDEEYEEEGGEEEDATTDEEVEYGVMTVHHPDPITILDEDDSILSPQKSKLPESQPEDSQAPAMADHHEVHANLHQKGGAAMGPSGTVGTVARETDNGNQDPKNHEDQEAKNEKLSETQIHGEVEEIMDSEDENGAAERAKSNKGVFQDRKPLRDDVEIPQSFEDQAMAQLDRLSKEGEANCEEHMAEMIKASCMHVIHACGLWGEAQNAIRNMAKEAADPDKGLHDELLAEEDERQSKKTARKGGGRGKGRGKGRGGKGRGGKGRGGKGVKGRGGKGHQDGKNDETAPHTTATAPGSDAPMETLDVDEPEQEGEHTASATVDEPMGEAEMGESHEPTREVLDHPNPPKRKKSKIVERKLKRLKLLSPSSSGKKAKQNPDATPNADPSEVNAVPEEAAEGDVQDKPHKRRRKANVKKSKSKAVSERPVQEIPEPQLSVNVEDDKQHEDGNGKPDGDIPEEEPEVTKPDHEDSEEKRKEEEKGPKLLSWPGCCCDSNGAISDERLHACDAVVQMTPSHERMRVQGLAAVVGTMELNAMC
eukprot:s1914_g7.t1